MTMKTFKLEFDEKELQYIGKLLRKCPFDEVVGIIFKMDDQIALQIKESERALQPVPSVTSASNVVNGK